MRAAVVVFPGSNADAEMIHTLRDVCGVPTTVVWHTATSLPPQTDLVAIPGGFSYGDYLRCGALAKGSPIVAALRNHADRGGYVLGVCNGFQILTEVGMLPGALTRNLHLRFECSPRHVRVTAKGPFTPRVGDVWQLPIAHAEGRYQASDAVLDTLTQSDCLALCYSTEDGNITDSANPNGSARHIAGIYGGPQRNIFGLMPHPERASEAIHASTDGRVLFEAVLRLR